MTSHGRIVGDGGYRSRPFLLVTLPATVVSLALIPAIVFGWISVTIVSRTPMGIVISGGSAQEVSVGLSSDVGITGVSTEAGSRAASRIEAHDSRLDDLCLVLRPGLPLVDDTVGLTIAVNSEVSLGQITLAADHGALGTIDLPTTTIGAADTHSASAASGFSIATDGTTQFDDLDAAAYGLVLDGGITLDALTLRAGSSGRC